MERMVDSLEDAFLLYGEAEEVNRRRTKEKLSGVGGGIYLESRAMYRAIAVSAVAAWEDFNEHLLNSGYDHLRQHQPNVPELTNWWPPKHLQAPNAYNVRRYFWSYFGIDPMPSWWFTFSARAGEVGQPGHWWAAYNEPKHLALRTRHGKEAAEWLDSLLRLRHANAHQDVRIYGGAPAVGVASKVGSSWGVAQHHAQNAIAVVSQLALCTLTTLAQHLEVSGSLRNSTKLSSWSLNGSTLSEMPQWPS